MPLKSIPGKKGQPREPHRVKCPKCNARLGVDVAAQLMQIWTGAHMNEKGRLVSGSKVWICARCWQDREWTPLG